MSSSRRHSVKQNLSQGGARHGYSDSGFGSLSDRASMRANPDRGFTAQDYSEQYGNLAALREALDAANQHIVDLKAQQAEVVADLAERSKDYRELKGRWDAMRDRCQVLEDDNANLLDSNKHLAREKENLAQENMALRDEINTLRRPTSSRQSPPLMTGASGQPSTLPMRNPSRREKDKNKEARDQKEQKEQKKRLSQRLNRDEPEPESPRTSRPPSAYIENWGPGRRRSSSVAPPPTRGGYAPNYTTTPGQEPVFAQSRQPTYSRVPRTIDPYDQQDGGYHGDQFPLPPPSRGRRER